MGIITACTGASQTGKAPAKCSISTPRKRSVDPGHRAVQHHRRVLCAVLADVAQPQARRLDEVHLDRRELPSRPSTSLAMKSAFGP